MADNIVINVPRQKDTFEGALKFTFIKKKMALFAVHLSTFKKNIGDVFLLKLVQIIFIQNQAKC